MENLSKQDFDEIFTESPETYKVFLAWLRKWGVENRYSILFNHKIIHEEYIAGCSYVPKSFFDLPFDLQKGVLLRFLCETYPRSKHEYVNKDKLKKILQNSVWWIEKTLK